MKFDSLEEFLEDEEYINRNGSPRKCRFCDCTEFKQVHKYYEEGHRLVEFQVQCLECGKINGIWAYGHWEIL